MPGFNNLILQTVALLAESPRLKAKLWRKLYDALSRKYAHGDWTFLNYGFWDDEIENLTLSAGDEPHRLFIGLYERITRGLDLREKEMMEVGSGRGGGAAYLARSKNPKLMIGLDYSFRATQLAQKLHQADGLRFQQGDALQIPFAADSFDIILNVESSHCYASMPQFLSEVARVLRAGGNFAWGDMRLRSEWDEVRAQFEAAGLKIESDEEITANVLKALDMIAPEKEKVIHAWSDRSRIPRWLRGPFADFAGMPGSKVYRLLERGEIRYGVIRARKL